MARLWRTLGSSTGTWKVLDANLIGSASNGESKVFYQRKKADYYRYVAEFTEPSRIWR